VTRPLHTQVAWRWRLERVAWRAAGGATAASAVAWAAGLVPAWHLAAMGIAALVGAAWPQRASERLALRWVGERVGLAYETAWEHATAPGAAGAHDERALALRAAAVVQGRLSIRDLRPPTPAAWWLPLATVALGLWVWAAWGPAATPGAWPAGTTPPQGPVGGPTAPADAASPDADDEADAGLPEDADADRAGATDPGRDGAPGAPGDPGSDGAASERQALERFLERLRERPVEIDEGSPQEVDGSVVGGPEDAADAMDGEDLAELLDRSELPPERRERPDAPSDADAQDALDGDDADGAPDALEPDPSGADAAEQEEAEAPGDEEGEGPSETDAPTDAPSGADEEAPGREDDGDDGATGFGVGAPGAGSEPSDPAAGDPEPLPSILGPGPEQAVGGVQMPGVAPDEVFPAGDAGTAFRRAFEETLNEGDLPASYLEVIRNYFR